MARKRFYATCNILLLVAVKKKKIHYRNCYGDVTRDIEKSGRPKTVMPE